MDDLRTAALALVAAVESHDEANMHGWSVAVRTALAAPPVSEPPADLRAALDDAEHAAFPDGFVTVHDGFAIAFTGLPGFAGEGYTAATRRVFHRFVPRAALSGDRPSPLTPCWFCKGMFPIDALIAGYDSFEEQRLACLACNERMQGNWQPGDRPSPRCDFDCDACRAEDEDADRPSPEADPQRDKSLIRTLERQLADTQHNLEVALASPATAPAELNVERLASAMDDAFEYADRFVDDHDGFWRPFAARVLARLAPATAPAELDVDALIAELSESPLPGARYAVSVVKARLARLAPDSAQEAAEGDGWVRYMTGAVGLDAWMAAVVSAWREAWEGKDHRYGRDFAAFVGERLITDFDLRDQEPYPFGVARLAPDSAQEAE